MGARSWDPRRDPRSHPFRHAFAGPQTRRRRGHGRHGGRRPSHRRPPDRIIRRLTRGLHAALLQGHLRLPHLVGCGLSTHQQLVRHLLPPVSNAQLKKCPGTRFYALNPVRGTAALSRTVNVNLLYAIIFMDMNRHVAGKYFFGTIKAKTLVFLL